MTLEDRIKELILLRYSTVKDFSKKVGLSYSTVDSILRRGVANSSISNVIKICKELGISVDELSEGKIVPVDMVLQEKKPMTKLEDIINFTRANIASYDNLTIHGHPLEQEDIETLMTALEVAMGIIAKQKKY